VSALAAAGWGALAASSLLIGALVALRWRLSHRVLGAVMGFGAGTLFSAVAYELVPEAVVGAGPVVGGLLLGALVFFIGDWFVDRGGGLSRKEIVHPRVAAERARAAAEAGGGQGAGAPATSGAAIFLGTLLDGVPESFILGLGLAAGGGLSIAFFVAVFASNLPEALAGTAGLRAAGRTPRAVLAMWAALVGASALAAAGGYLTAVLLPGVDASFANAFAAGAVLTMLADTMMPEAFENGGPAVGLVTTLGFIAAAALTLLE
jgi:ZIP family zinc transporter